LKGDKPDPDKAEWLYLKANCERQLLKHEAAVGTYTELLKVHSAGRFANAGRYEKALTFYKRGMFDLLLLHRLGQAAWGEEAGFGVDIWAHQLWGGSDWLSLLSSVIPPEKLFRRIKPNSFHAKVYENYKRFKELKDIDGLSYHAHKRAAHVIQGSVKEKRVLAKHCLL